MPIIESTDFVYENGMYGSGEDSYLEKITDLNASPIISSLSDPNTDGNVYTDIFGVTPTSTEPTEDFTKAEDGKTIFGLPPHFCKTADPNGRVFQETIMRDMSLLYIIPGKCITNKTLISDDGTTIKKGTLFSALENLANDTSSEGILNLALKGVRNRSDIRFGGFKADYKTYYKYVQLLCNTVYVTMGLPGNFYFGDENSPDFSKYGLCYYLGNSTSISESANNAYTEATSTQTTNDKSFESREYNTVMNTDDESFFEKGIKFITASFSKFDDPQTTTDLLTRQGQAFARVTNGSNLLYPQIWSNSTFSRSYNVSLRFYSPYGDKESIFKNVYVPFLSVLAFCLPRQDSTLGMGEPFYIRLNNPGWFESSLAIVDSVSFVKGGNDNLWSLDGLPLEMEVSMSIMDIYPAMPITRKYSHLSYNAGLSSFLDTLAGIRSDQLNFSIGVKRFIKTRLSVPENFVRHGIGNIVSNFFTNLQLKASDRIR